MDPINFAAAVTTLISTTTKTIDYLNHVKNASKERTALSREIVTLLQLLVSLKNQVEEESQVESWLDGIRSLAVEHGPIDELQGSLEQLAKKLKPATKVASSMSALVWPLDKKYCDTVLSKIERLKSTINLARQDHIHKIVDETKRDTQIIRDRMQHVEDVTARQRILEWFSPLDFSRVQQDILRKREPGTGQWLLNAPKFQNWVTGSERTLCCVGIPGAGKSVLASIVVEHVRNIQTSGQSVGVAALYCNFKEHDIQTLENLFASLCVQFIGGSQHLTKALVDLYDSHQRVKKQPILEEILKVLTETVESLSKVYLIIDALDECPVEIRNIFIQELRHIGSTARILVTTRVIDSIVQEFTKESLIDVRANQGDLEKYIRSRIANSDRLGRLSRGETMVEAEICSNIITKANGMFLAAKLHLDSLSNKLSLKALRRALDSLPNTLHGLYDDALSRIDAQNNDDREIAYKLIRWVSYAYRPLSCHELQEALAIEPGDERYDPEALPLISDALDACAGLLVIEDLTESYRLVRLVHYTAQDYFDELLSSRFKDAHTSIGRECLTYLSYDEFQSAVFGEDYKPGPEAKCLQGEIYYRLLDYASKYWAQHYIINQDPDLDSQIYECLTRNFQICHYSTRVEYYGVCLHDSSGYGIATATYYGLYDILRRLLQNGHNPRDLTDNGASALHIAAFKDDVTAVEILLEHGAELDHVWSSWGTPLITAIQISSVKVAYNFIERRLSDRVDASLQAQEVATFANVRWDHPIPFLQLLLDYGADINCEDGTYRTQLMKRAKNNDIKTVQWLLERGAYVNLMSACRETALSWASYNGNEELVKLLLEHNARLDVVDDGPNTHDSPLYSACRGGSPEVVKLLLRQGSKVNTRDHIGFGPLHQASIEGHAAIMQVLLDSGSDLDAQDNFGDTALHLAARQGHREPVSLLIREHADLNAVNNSRKTPLGAAIDGKASSEGKAVSNLTRPIYGPRGEQDSYTAIIHDLISAGTSTDVRDIYGMSALHLASAYGDVASIKSIINSQPTTASLQSHSLVVDLGSIESDLVEDMANLWVNIDAPDRKPLWICAPRKHEEVIVEDDLLLVNHLVTDRNMIEHCCVWRNMTPLDFAYLRNDLECIKLLQPLASSKNGRIKMTPVELAYAITGCSTIPEVKAEIDRR